MGEMKPSVKSKIGCWVHERWRTELVLLAPRFARRLHVRWQDLRNRREDLDAGEGGARVCRWEDSSFLTVARMFPRVGARLLRHCLREWPIRPSGQPPILDADTPPRLSVVLPVGGQNRSAQLSFVLTALFGQTLRELEILVVEHSEHPHHADLCPEQVRYIFIPKEPGCPFNKSRAMNAGAAEARAPYMLLHDADMVPPAAYAHGIVQRLEAGWDGVRPLRFSFRLGPADSEALIQSLGERLPDEVELVHQNFPGASTALKDDVYREIGGHDERFEGWGGEDTEFLDRLRTRRLYPGGYSIAIHLWHPPAPELASGDRDLDLTLRLAEVPVHERIRTLRDQSETA